MSSLTWYFDFVSPFSYLQMHHFGEIPADMEIVCRPVLFAGLLNHFQGKGPAEVPPKRVFTYRYLQWYAESHGIPYRMPPAHPFNPLKALRLCIALGGGPDAVDQIFRFIWEEGRAPDDEEEWRVLAGRLGAPDADTRIQAREVKDALRRNTEEAAARNVFGVPTFEIDGRIFWGVDATPMLIDYLEGHPVFDSEEMRRVSELPEGVRRKF